MQYKYITVEGNIGVGKSTIAKLLASHYQASYLPEEFEDNNFLPEFYKEPGKYALPLELSFLADRFKQINNKLNSNLGSGKPLIADYHFIKCKLFAGVNLKLHELELFLEFYNILVPQLPVPDLIIFLHADISQLLQNIKKRGRAYEQQISSDYLANLENAYMDFLKLNKINALFLDVKGIDFNENQNFLLQVAERIDKGGIAGIEKLQLTG